MQADNIYRPLTATPFKCCAAYKEIEPCRMLKPYIRCFWCGEYSGREEGAELSAKEYSYTDYPRIVIPDTCVDIIYRIDHIDRKVTAGFSGINDRSFYVCGGKKAGHKLSVFAIRFYAWGAYAFAEDSFKGTLNGHYDVRERFNWLDKELRSRLAEPGNLADRIRLTERLLLERLEASRSNHVINDAISNILLNHGSVEVSRLSKECFVSGRQLERLFLEYIGITPKKLSNLVRYQFLWKDIVTRNDFDIMDAVHKYGYTDSAHLMREFKRYHSMNIRAARDMAFKHRSSVRKSG